MALLAVIGASLLYGDGVITPAISVLSAVEGLTIASPRLSPLVLPLTCGILIALFAIQRRGTGSVGKLFGPVMTVWFMTLAILGMHHIVQQPEILGALSPHHGAGLLLPPRIARHADPGLGRPGGDGRRSAVRGHGPFWRAAHSPGVVVLRAARAGVVLPGTRCAVLRDPEAIENPFYSLGARGLPTYLLILLSSAATVIASQALISGAFSLTRQAMLLGYLPRMTIKHTAYHTEGQIYIPEVNKMLAVGCLALVLTFRESVKLAAAYGIAVTGTMAITSILYYIVTRYTWGWSNWKAGALSRSFPELRHPVSAGQPVQVLRRRLRADADRRGADCRHADLEPRPDRAHGTLCPPLPNLRHGPADPRSLVCSRVSRARPCSFARAPTTSRRSSCTTSSAAARCTRTCPAHRRGVPPSPWCRSSPVRG